MSYVEVPGAKVPIRMWADPATVEGGAMQQLRNVATLPWIKGLAVMPDVHYGKGATVGSVIAMHGAVCPAAVGVDIGCGMSAVKSSLTADDRDLAVFIADTPQMAAYRHDLFWAQEYAKYNRAIMMSLFQDVVRKEFAKARPVFEPVVSCHHNYVAEERYEGMDLLVTRKGAIRAGSGDYGIIPGSMGTGSYIVRGLGNEASFNSASHGAGRKMSRHAAKKRFSTRDLEEQTRGVECRKDSGVVDEIPGAYKPIEKVIDQQRDLVEVVARLKQVVCVKG